MDLRESTNHIKFPCPEQEETNGREFWIQYNRNERRIKESEKREFSEDDLSLLLLIELGCQVFDEETNLSRFELNSK